MTTNTRELATQLCVAIDALQNIVRTNRYDQTGDCLAVANKIVAQINSEYVSPQLLRVIEKLAELSGNRSERVIVTELFQAVKSYRDFMEIGITKLAAPSVPESFASHPKSISEIRGDKAGNGKEWKPRDALIAALRDLDSGEINPDYVVIVIGKVKDDGGTSTTYYQATPNAYVMLGMIEDLKRHIAD